MHRRIGLVAPFALALSSLSLSSTRVSCDVPSQKTNLKDKVVIVTGATAGTLLQSHAIPYFLWCIIHYLLGIGKAIAWKFAHKGAKLVLIGRRETLLESLKQDITAKYPAAKIHTIAMSVTDLEKVKDLPSTLPEEYRDVEVLVNNAGLEDIHVANI